MSKNNNCESQTFEGAIKQFLTNTKAKLKQSTFSRYTFICERYILPYFKQIELKNLNNDIINKFIQDKIENGGLKGLPLSAKTISDMVCLLKQIIKNYCKSIDFDINIIKPCYKQQEITVFSDIEYNKLKTYLSFDTDNKKLGIIIAMLTGIRIGELCALKWENIDLENGTIFINKTIQRIKNTDDTEENKTKIIIDVPKSTTSIRIIPIPQILINKLKNFKAHNHTYLLTNTENYIEPRIYQRHFKHYLKICKIKDNKFHSLRHTFATMAISKGIDVKTLSILLGHADVGFTMKRYVHPNMEHKREQIEKLAIGF
ncbi:MAG: site-specific integrase [Oscillospiraceae bacterium]|nr:site-specific integrase [Oscillospiraceae bacterium]